VTQPAAVAARKGSRLAPELTDAQLATLSDHVAFATWPGEGARAEGTSDNHLYVILSGNLGVVRGAGTSNR
jgi:hypothetical protein